MTTATTLSNERIVQRFQLYDVNRDNVIERADLEAEAQRIIDAFGESPDSPRGSALLEAYRALWEFMAEKTGAGSTGSVNLDKFTTFTQQPILGPGSAGFARVLRPTVSAMVALVDTDGDGRVSPPEFTRWLNAIGVDRASAEQAFQVLDVNRDGQLDTDELVNAVREYHEGRLDVPLLGGIK